MKLDHQWREVVKHAEHYLAIGQTEVYIEDKDLADLPWEYVTAVRPGGSHRLDIDTSVWFTAEHPCGVILRWTFDIEPRSANGKGHYEIDTDGVRAVLRALPPDAQILFRSYLRECAAKVDEKAREWRAIAAKQEADAGILWDLARAPDGASTT